MITQCYAPQNFKFDSPKSLRVDETTTPFNTTTTEHTNKKHVATGNLTWTAKASQLFIKWGEKRVQRAINNGWE